MVNLIQRWNPPRGETNAKPCDYSNSNKISQRNPVKKGSIKGTLDHEMAIEGAGYTLK